VSHAIHLSGVIVHEDAFDPTDNRPWIRFPDGVSHLRRRHNALISACVTWASGQGRVVDPDVVALLCGAAEEGFNGGSVTRWTVERMYHMLCCHIPNWCDIHRVAAPNDVYKEPLWLLVRFLVAGDRLDDRSDPPDLVLEVLRCQGINASGFESDDEADWHYEDAPFEYDGPTYGELKRLTDGS
jgi:hypothetical protein